MKEICSWILYPIIILILSKSGSFYNSTLKIILNCDSESSSISTCQWNFLPYFSSTSPLTSVVQDWLIAFEEGNIVFFHSHKTFDSVPHASGIYVTIIFYTLITRICSIQCKYGIFVWTVIILYTIIILVGFLGEGTKDISHLLP